MSLNTNYYMRIFDLVKDFYEDLNTLFTNFQLGNKKFMQFYIN